MKNVNKSGYGISASGDRYNITIYTRGYIKHGSKKYLKELPKDIYGLFLKLYKLTPLVVEDYYAGKTTYKEEYKSLLYEILNRGYKPTLFDDMEDYYKRYTKFIKDNVEFREMEVDIVVR